MSSVDPPVGHVTLYVKAGWNGVGLGACPFCQRFFMLLDRKAGSGSLTYDVITVNTARPEKEFQSIARKLPALRHGDEVISDMNEMTEFLASAFPKPPLELANPAAHAACLDVFSKFAFFLKDVAHTPEALITELSRIDNFLADAKTSFLCGNSLTSLDCSVLPKLQHIRVASFAFKNFEIPSDMKALWRYLGNAYADESFRKSCPSDQEIVHYWSVKRETAPLPHDKLIHYTVDACATPRFSLALPDGQQ